MTTTTAPTTTAASHRQQDRDLGSGSRFGADVYELYEAGHVAFPDLAELYSHAATELHHVHGLLTGIARRLGRSGGWAVADQAEQVCDAARVTAHRLHRTGEALVELADDFRRTDDGAAHAFRRLTREHRDLLSSAAAWSPPPGSGDPVGCRPGERLDDAAMDERLTEAGVAPVAPLGPLAGGG